jgi:hypothetical protein
MVTGSKGLPLANTQRPSVYLYASSAVHSALLVGLDKANTIGLLLIEAIFFNIDSVNTPEIADTPYFSFKKMS